MHDTTITVQGYAGTDVDLRSVGDTSVAIFRLAATPRRFDRRLNDWVDAATQWYTVKAWRNLGRNVAFSVRRGDAVVVHGRLVANTWSKDGQDYTSMELEATMVGHDLNRGITQLQKPPKPTPAGEAPLEAEAEAEAEAGARAEAPEEGAAVTIGSRGETAPDEWLPARTAAA